MENEDSEFFSLAAKHFLKKYKAGGGTQSQFADELGISRAYLSSLINGSKSPSFELSTEIARRLYGSLDKFLYVGRRIKEGRSPIPEDQENQEYDDVEHLIARLTHYVLDHKRIEKEISNLKQFYETIIENLQSSVCVTDSRHKFTFVNNRIEEVLGVKSNKLLGTSILHIQETFSELELYPFIDEYMKAYEEQAPRFFNNIHLVSTRDSVHYFSGWFIPLYEDKRFKGMICTIRDTSDAHAYYNLLLHSIDKLPDPTLIVRQHNPGDIPFSLFANEKFRDLFKLYDMDPFSLPFEEFLNAIKGLILNGKEWQQFIMQTVKNNTVNAKFDIQHSEGGRFRSTSNPITDNHDVHIGRLITLEELSG